MPHIRQPTGPSKFGLSTSTTPARLPFHHLSISVPAAWIGNRGPWLVLYMLDCSFLSSLLETPRFPCHGSRRFIRCGLYRTITLGIRRLGMHCFELGLNTHACPCSRCCVTTCHVTRAHPLPCTSCVRRPLSFIHRLSLHTEGHIHPGHLLETQAQQPLG